MEYLRNMPKTRTAAQPNLTFFGVPMSFFCFQKKYVVHWLCKNEEIIARMIDYQLVR